MIGCGPVALCAIVCALEYRPARIFAVDSVASRLQRAAELGCIPLDYQKVDVEEEVKKSTEGLGAHAAIEAVGSGPALRTAWNVVAPGGKISSVGKSCTNHYYTSH